MQKSAKLSKSLSEGLQELVFEPEGHKYFRGKKRIPSVSEILKKIGQTKDFTGVDPFYRNRGKAAHLAIQLYLEGRLDPTSLDPAIRNQFEAFLQFWDKHSDEKIIAIEKPMSDLSDTFAGTPDLITDKAIYDWKCSKDHDRAADLQGQAYKMLNLFNGSEMHLPFIVLELHDDMTIAEFNYGPAYDEWPAVMTLYRWRDN